MTQCQPFAKLKEVQANTQAIVIAPHLILPNRTETFTVLTFTN